MSTYPPLGTLKPVAEGIWIVDGPAVECRRIPLSTRATVVKLADDTLWVHSPTGLCDGLIAELEALGPVAHLIVPSWSHSIFLEEWRETYPRAQVWAVEPEGERGAGVTHDHTLGGDTPWMNDLSHHIVLGSKRHREAVFFHRPSSTLIVTDLIQNIDTARLSAWVRPLVWMAGTDTSDGKMPYLMRRTYRNAELGRSIEHIVAWQPRALILCHGDWFPRGAVQELERAFKKLVHERQWSRALDDMDRKN